MADLRPVKLTGKTVCATKCSQINKPNSVGTNASKLLNAEEKTSEQIERVGSDDYFNKAYIETQSVTQSHIK